MTMRLPNGYGSVTKLSGKRRNPYMVRITAGIEYDPVKDKYVQKRAVLGYYRTKADALAALADYSKSPYNVLESSMSVGDLWDTIKDSVDASDNRKQVYKRVFNQYMTSIKDMRIKDVKAKQLQQVMDECDKGSSTKGIIRSVMNRIFRYAVQNDLVEKNYVDFVKYEHEATSLERQVYTDEEIRKLWDHVDDDYYAITLILLHQGMRIKELEDLTPDDIDLENNTINIRQGKNQYSIRKIPINMAVIDLLKRRKDESLYYTKTKYYYFCKTTLMHTPYDVRHTFATKANQLGIDLLIRQRIMGHKPDTLLESVYTHLTMEELSDAINKVIY